ncbi:MAG: hypothetical protein P1P90_04205 [Patescibacteria group bacterium]|nr:hypothetical protein [Patescibacteria group bacterium]
MKKFKRVVVIAPTRSTCVNISVVLSNDEIPPTLLLQEKGEELADAVIHLEDGGFGVVAGTGTGKTVAIRDICAAVLENEKQVDVVTREHEATDYTWTCNVLVVTPGVAVNWLKSRKITADDLIVIDEIHQTSEHLELAMALAKRVGCTFIWMSATIDPAKYEVYLGARTVIRCEVMDSTRRANVSVEKPAEWRAPLVPDRLLMGMKDKIIREKRGVACFVPTRAMAEQMAELFAREDGIHSEFYHGGETAEKLRPYLLGEIEKPFIVFMTIAGASSLNITGLDTVVIVDEWYTEVLKSGGVKSLEKLPLGPNELLQMGGRVHGRAENGEIYILSKRDVDFHSLKPEAPQFKLGGDLERVALTCAKLRVDARELDLIGYIDLPAYARIVDRFRDRGLIKQNGDLKLTDYGAKVERLPVEPHWGEMLVRVEERADIELMDVMIAISSVGSLYSLTRNEFWVREGLVVEGSDHLTSYNIVATALREFGYIKYNGELGPEYKLRGDWFKKRHGDEELGEFRSWCEQRMLNPKAIKEALLAMKSVYKLMGHKLLEPTEFPLVSAGSDLHQRFLELLANTQSLEFSNRSQNSGYSQEIWSAKTSVAHGIRKLGTVRFWKDTKGWIRATMEGTVVPEELVQKYSKKQVTSVSIYDGESYRVVCQGTFAGEQLEGWEEISKPDEVPAEYQPQLPYMFAEWVVRQMC